VQVRLEALYLRSQGVANGADANAQDGYGQIALIVAVEQGNIEIVQILLKSGADANAKAKDGNGWTALIGRAGWNNHAELVQLLKKASAQK